MNKWRTGGALAGLVGLAGVAESRSRARGIPFSPVDGGSRIGSGFPERAGLVDDNAATPAGEMDDFDAFARPDFDTDRVAPDIRAFYETTSDFEMTYRARWHRPFRTGARLAAPLTTHIQQLNLPAPGDAGTRTLESRFVPIDPDADPRPGARAWIRTDPDTGEAVFVALYAHHDARNERFVNIAAPLPGGNLSTVLHLESVATDSARGDGLRLTTRAPGDPGLYWVRGGTGFWLPMEQTFTVWPADATNAPDAPGDGPVVATHEMWLLGGKFLTVTYGITR
ncbi:hypothetical protein [Salarchaeum sp. JOR-1]|uniref:hypothetical protein n=1 Tax=Salarchaeum sp. JOR-1 TaxID=2599399 RepID=UPI001198BA8D|nr:hypothetical protein [Salarchaeum sp. JOR-1]QDX40409.1 hypothetical protein FQU85_05655 [Salarchaeum sp. JOR-1]